MTAILTVDTLAMHRLAGRLRAVAAQVRAVAIQVRSDTADARGVQSQVVALGPPCLVQATGTFLDRWGGTFADLADDARRLADAVDLIARSYQDAESVTARGMLG